MLKEGCILWRARGDIGPIHGGTRHRPLARFRDQIVLGGEVSVKAAVRELRRLHDVGDADAVKPAHLLGFAVTIEPLAEVRNAPLSWYVGLDADATQIGNALWNGEELGEEAMARVVGLFRVTFRDARLMLDKVRGEPIYLVLAMTRDKLIRMKPQNLVAGLPVKHLEAVS